MDEQIFKPESKSIRQLFADTDAWYKVPEFQRPYRWMDEQVSQLWDDLRTAFKQHTDDSPINYFLGAIIVSTSEKKDGYFDVIDGQQRLTTLMILFSVIRDHYPEINKGSEYTKAIKIKDLHRAIDDGEADDDPRMKFNTILLPYDGAVTCFIDFISKRGATREDYDSPTKEELRDDNPKHNYIQTVQTFRRELSELPIKEISNFINFVFNYVNVIRIECASTTIAIELFQIINTRGMNLRPSDLIKSFLLIEIKSDQEKTKSMDYHVKYDNFITGWLKIGEDIQDTDSNMDEILILYSYYKLTDSPGKDFYLYDKLKKCLKEDFDNKKSSPNDIAADIERFVKNYKNHIAENKDITIYALLYLPWKNLWKSILLSLIQEKYHKPLEGYQRLTKQIFRFYYLHWIAGNTMSKVKKVSLDVIKDIKKNESVEDIAKKLNGHLEKHDVIKKALEYLNSNNAGDEFWCKPLLLSIDYTLKEEGAEVFIKNDAKSQLEHILPKGFKKKTGWEHISDDTADIYLNSLGNLTLLSGPKNREASNKPLDEKIKYYDGNISRQPNPSKFQLTRKIIDEYKDGEKKWNESAIKKRREYVLKEAAKLLEIQEEMEQFLKENKEPKKPN